MRVSAPDTAQRFPIRPDAPLVRLNVGPTRGGVRLPADVVHPPAPAPVVLVQTPYGRTELFAEAQAWARAGLAFVAQDVRGRGDADGLWSPWGNHERLDAAAMVRWAVDQPFCDGRVVTVGTSYEARLAALAASEEPDLVRAVARILPLDHPSDLDGGDPERCGERLWWWAAQAAGRHPRPSQVSARWPEIEGASDEQHAIDLLGIRPPPQSSQQDAIAGHARPTLHVGSWFDPSLPSVLRASRPREDTAHPDDRTVVGPWQLPLHRRPVDSCALPVEGAGHPSRPALSFIRSVLAGTPPPADQTHVLGAGWQTGRPAPTRSTLRTDDDSAGPTGWTPLAPIRVAAIPDGSPLPDERTGVIVASLAADEPTRSLIGTPVVELEARGTPGSVLIARLVCRSEDRITLASGSFELHEPGPAKTRACLAPLAVQLPVNAALELHLSSSWWPQYRTSPPGIASEVALDSVSVTFLDPWQEYAR